MKTVGELIGQLEKYNRDAKVHVIAHCKSFDFSICIGRSEGVTKETTKEVNFYVDTLCQNEHLESEDFTSVKIKQRIGAKMKKIIKLILGRLFPVYLKDVELKTIEVDVLDSHDLWMELMIK